MDNSGIDIHVQVFFYLKGYSLILLEKTPSVKRLNKMNFFTEAVEWIGLYWWPTKKYHFNIDLKNIYLSVNFYNLYKYSIVQSKITFWRVKCKTKSKRNKTNRNKTKPKTALKRNKPNETKPTKRNETKLKIKHDNIKVKSNSLK